MQSLAIKLGNYANRPFPLCIVYCRIKGLAQGGEHSEAPGLSPGLHAETMQSRQLLYNRIVYCCIVSDLKSSAPARAAALPAPYAAPWGAGFYNLAQQEALLAFFVLPLALSAGGFFIHS